MNVKTPKDVTRAANRAMEQLKESGVDVKYTQVLSAIAAFHGFSNREEFLASVKKTDSAKPSASGAGQPQLDPAVLRELALAAREAAAARRDDGDDECAGEYERAADAADQLCKQPVLLEEQAIGYVHKDWTPDQGQGRIFGHSPGPDYRAVAFTAAAQQQAGLMPQAKLLEVVMQVLDRIADGQDFNEICEDTGVSALVSQQQVLLRGGTIAGQPKKGETFIERVLRMSPAELTHADHRMVVNALRRAFGEIRDTLGYEPGWMLPYITVADGLNNDAEKLERERAYPHQVVAYYSSDAFREGRFEQLVPARDLAEAVKEMRKRLDDNPEFFGCAVLSTDLSHRYYSLVRGIDGNLRELPDGLSEEVGKDTWGEMCAELPDLFRGDVYIGGGGLREVTMAIESRLCRGKGEEPADLVLKEIGFKTRKAYTCAELYALLKATRAEVEERQRQELEQPSRPVASEAPFETEICGAKFKVVDGVICGQHNDGTYSLRFPGHRCSTREEFEHSVNNIFQFQW